MDLNLDDNREMLWETSPKAFYTTRPSRKISLEEWVILYLLAAEREANTPPYFYGMVNSLILYLDHPAYSPFKPLPDYLTEEARNANIAEGITSFDLKKYLNSEGHYFTSEEWSAKHRAEKISHDTKPW